jgi:hypothetical protein
LHKVSPYPALSSNKVSCCIVLIWRIGYKNAEACGSCAGSPASLCPDVILYSDATPSGIIKPGEDIEVVGLRPVMKTTVTGVEMFKKSLAHVSSPDTLSAGLTSLQWLCSWTCNSHVGATTTCWMGCQLSFCTLWYVWPSPGHIPS